MKYSILLLATACGSDAFLSFPPDAGDEASDSNAADSNTADSNAATDAPPDTALDCDGAASSGHVTCKSVIDEYCTRLIACGANFSSIAACEMDVSQSPNRDCSKSMYDKNICTNTADACVEALKTASCGAGITNIDATFSKPPCSTFFNQF